MVAVFVQSLKHYSQSEHQSKHIGNIHQSLENHTTCTMSEQQESQSVPSPDQAVISPDQVEQPAEQPVEQPAEQQSVLPVEQPAGNAEQAVIPAEQVALPAEQAVLTEQQPILQEQSPEQATTLPEQATTLPEIDIQNSENSAGDSMDVDLQSEESKPEPEREPMEEPTLHISGLPVTVKASELAPILEAFGEVTKIVILPPKNIYQAFGFVSFKNREDAERCLEDLDQKKYVFDSQYTWKVNWAKQGPLKNKNVGPSGRPYTLTDRSGFRGRRGGFRGGRGGFRGGSRGGFRGGRGGFRAGHSPY